MQSFFEAPKDIIGILAERLTDFSTVVDTLESVRNDPETYNKILYNVKAFLTNQSKKYPLKVDYLYGFPNLEVVKVKILGDANTLMGLVAQPKLVSFHFRFAESEKNYKDAIYNALLEYCTGTFMVNGREYTNNRDLRNVDFQIYTKMGFFLFILVKGQIYVQRALISIPLNNLLNKYTTIKGVWNKFGPMYSGSIDNVIYHETIYPYLGMKVDVGFLNLNYNRFKVHISGEDTENFNLRITYFLTEFWKTLHDFQFLNVIQFDCPIIINSLNELDETVFLIFPNVKEIMVIPNFRVNELISEYNGKILKFYQLPQSSSPKLPKLETYNSIYDAMIKESNL